MAMEGPCQGFCKKSCDKALNPTPEPLMPPYCPERQAHGVFFATDGPGRKSCNEPYTWTPKVGKTIAQRPLSIAHKEYSP